MAIETGAPVFEATLPVAPTVAGTCGAEAPAVVGDGVPVPSGARPGAWAGAWPGVGNVGVASGATTVGPDAAGSSIDAARFSAAPYAAVMPRMAVADSPVERMRADLAACGRFFFDVAGVVSSVIVVFPIVIVVVLALFVLFVVVIVIVIVTTWRRQERTRRIADSSNDFSVCEAC